MARHVPAGTAAARDHPRPGGEMRRDRGRLGPFLCWGVVFADIGTSVYYTPGILFHQPGIGTHAAPFVAVIVHVGPAQLLAALPRVLSGPRLTPLQVLTGYAGAFLAFSGLESISQLSPAIAEPRRRVVQGALRALVATMALTSPLLTLWSTTVLPITTTTDPNQFISLLAGYAAGHPLEIEVAVSGALLLVFASNTALIGSYHVFLALARRGFLPPVLMQRNRMPNT